MEVYAYLRQDINIQKSKQYPVISDMNMSESEMTKYAHSIHKLIDQRGSEFALEKILDVYRVNPLLAVKTMESCSLNERSGDIVSGMKLLFGAVRGDNDINNAGHRVVLNAMVPYTILLIEAAYQNSVSDIWDTKEVFLSYAKDEDYNSYKRNEKIKFLNGYNIRHILRNIPDNRQIELINWFWDKHCFAVKNYNKKRDTYSGRRVAIMISELTDSCLWKHLENMDNTEVSEKERESKSLERFQIQRFVKNTIQEGRHLQYIKVILGEDNFYDKLRVLMGEDGVEEYDIALKKQKQIEEEEAQLQIQRERFKRYNDLVEKVKIKYLSVQDSGYALQWYQIGRKKSKDQLSLWNYWQGFNFDDVKIMVLGLDWGSVNDQNKEMEECIRKICALKSGNKDAKYYSCKYRKTDHNLELLFKKCFGRDIRKTHYSDLYFSTLCLGYRKQSNTEISDELIKSDIDDFLIDEIDIIKPDAIFCLGPKVHKLFMEGIEESAKSHEEVKLESLDSQTIDPCNAAGRASGMQEYNDGVPRKIIIRGNVIWVYALPHCSAAGVKRMSLESQLAVWNNVRDHMRETEYGGL